MFGSELIFNNYLVRRSFRQGPWASIKDLPQPN